MNKEKIEVLLRLVMYDIVLNYSTLISYNFSDEDIFWMLDNKIIMQVKDDKYKLLSVESLRRYGLKLLTDHNGKEANICFRKCYQMAPNSRKICMQYMMSLIRREDYQEALNVYDTMTKRGQVKYEKDDNLYLYLFSILTNLNSEKANKVINFGYRDIMLDKNWQHKDENEIRKAILNSKFTYAYKLITARIYSNKDEYSVKYELIRWLLVHVLEYEKKFKANLFDLANDGEFKKIILILKNRERQRNLSKLETYILIICEAIVNIKNIGIVPEIIVEDTDNMYEALMGYNFELALRLNNGFLQYTGDNPSNDIINILLVKINGLINDTKLLDEEEDKGYTRKRVLYEK